MYSKPSHNKFHTNRYDNSTVHPVHHELPTGHMRPDNGRQWRTRLDEHRREMTDSKRDIRRRLDRVRTSAILDWKSHLEIYFTLCQTTDPSHNYIFAYSRGDYLDPTLTTLHPYTHSTRSYPTSTSTLPIVTVSAPPATPPNSNASPCDSSNFCKHCRHVAN